MKEFFKNRFSKFTIHDYIIVGFSFFMSIIGLYFSIGMSVTLSKGLALFGDTTYRGSEVEKVGPTPSDKNILTLFWILTIAVLLFSFYYLFLYKVDKEKPKRKEVVDFAVEEMEDDTSVNE